MLVTLYSEQQKRSHVWKIWSVHLIEGQRKFVNLYKYLATLPIIPPIGQPKKIINQLGTPRDTINSQHRSHSNGFVADS